MPKGTEKELTKLIPRIYKRNAENMMLFCWVNAQRQILPTITIQQAIWNFFRFTEIDSWDMESAQSTYCRMQKEYFEDCKQLKDDKN
jgi:hypothetical protein